MFRNGDTFGKYRIERTLGTGGMGEVYLVRHSVLDSLFALKILDDAIAKKGEDFVTRFIREAKLSSNIRHPNLAAVHDAGRDEATGLYYLVMEYLPGGTLRDRIHERGRIAVPEAARIARQVAAALVTAHERGMVHRDIKPENIMFAADGSARLADLGIAKGTGEQDTLVTMASAVFGTPAYMAPEQARDSSSVDGRADIWSLGVVLYEMLSGRRPYEGNGLAAVVKPLLSSEPFPDVRAVAPDVPSELAELIADMCRKDAAQRIADARDVVARLSSFGNLPARTETETLATQATVGTLPSLEEPSVFVEPKVATEVREFEAEREARIRRASVRRRSRMYIAVLALICVLLGMFVVVKDVVKTQGEAGPAGNGGAPDNISQTNDRPKAAPQPPKSGPEPEPRPAHADNGPLAKPPQQPPTVPPETTAPPETTLSPQTTRPQPPDGRICLVGVAGEENGLAAAAGVKGLFIQISGRPKDVSSQVMNALARAPEEVYVSLCGYAAGRRMSESSFELFLRGMIKALSSESTHVVLLADATAYGRIVRAVAQECSIDVVP